MAEPAFRFVSFPGTSGVRRIHFALEGQSVTLCGKSGGVVGSQRIDFYEGAGQPAGKLCDNCIYKANGLHGHSDLARPYRTPRFYGRTTKP